MCQNRSFSATSVSVSDRHMLSQHVRATVLTHSFVRLSQGF
jgi:hypothetical protein